MNTDQQYASKLRRLLKDFEEGGASSETDADVADALLKLCLDLGRLRQPKTVDTRGKELIDRATLKKMAIWDTDDPSFSTIEKIFSIMDPMSKNVMDVANGPGTKIYPGELKKALDLLAKGKGVDYEGATAVNFTDVGEAFGSFLEKEVKGGKFKTKKQR